MTSLLENNKSIYILDKTIWQDFANELIQNGYLWSGKTSVEVDLEKNTGISSKYINGEPFIIDIYDAEHKLFCIKPIYLLPEVEDFNSPDEAESSLAKIKDCRKNQNKETKTKKLNFFNKIYKKLGD